MARLSQREQMLKAALHIAYEARLEALGCAGVIPEYRKEWSGSHPVSGLEKELDVVVSDIFSWLEGDKDYHRNVNQDVPGDLEREETIGEKLAYWL